METTRQSFEILTQGCGREAMLRHIERCARVSYKSEGMMMDGSAEAFCDMLISRGHTSPLEHGTVYAKMPKELACTWEAIPHSRVRMSGQYGYVTTNYRVVLEWDFPLEIMRYQCAALDGLHVPRVTVKFITNRAVANEFVRHRVFSFTQESTRYVNYQRRGLVLIEPTFTSEWRLGVWREAVSRAEEAYNVLCEEGCTPQEARGVLPLDTKTELVMTGFTDEWEGFFKLRCDKAAHPQARELAEGVRNELETFGIAQR